MTPGLGRRAVAVPIEDLRREFDAIPSARAPETAEFSDALERAERRAYWVGVGLRALYAVLPQRLFARALWKICRIRVWA